jgi:hypothetical protein
MNGPLARRLKAALLALAAGGLAGCGSGELPPCDAPERRAEAGNVAPMAPAMRDSITRAFTGRSHIQQVTMEQRDCHFRVAVRVDSFATPRYASTQGIELVRVLKKNAPNETRPLVEDPAGEVGVGIYDYAVFFERAGRKEQSSAGRGSQKPGWVRITKPYDGRRVSVSRQ